MCVYVVYIYLYIFKIEIGKRVAFSIIYNSKVVDTYTENIYFVV